ncbi:MAG TPA: DUF1841 family protein [Burkholderiales bacterium]|nr:DUF1841 family protein [Burkholderiales bacterium]
MFNPSRDEARRFFFDTWKKYKEGKPLSGLEQLSVEIIIQHPEYHSVMNDPARYLNRDYLPETGDINPFLHMGMHLAIEEQLSIDQPRGIYRLFKRILQNNADRHAAFHLVMECLAEMMWHAQRANTKPDERIYFECLERRSATTTEKD